MGVSDWVGVGGQDACGVVVEGLILTVVDVVEDLWALGILVFVLRLVVVLKLVV